MRTYIWFVVIFCGIKALVRIIFLGLNCYPRTVTWKPWEDVIGFMEQLIWVFLGLYVLNILYPG